MSVFWNRHRESFCVPNPVVGGGNASNVAKSVLETLSEADEAVTLSTV